MKIRTIRIGTAESLNVKLYDGNTDAVLPLANYTGWSGSAKHTKTGAVVMFSSVLVTDAANGRIKLDYSAGAFTVAGIYDIDLIATDPAGKPVIYPHERGGLKLRVDLANI